MAKPEEPPPSLEPKTIEVPADKSVFVLFGKPGERRVFVYLHGRCGNPLAFKAFASVVPARGTLVSVVGEVACPGGRAKWGDDVVALDGRIKRALDAVEAARGEPLDKEHPVAMGYSAGALRAEALSNRFPDRYQRVVLIGGPRAPRTGALVKAHAILLMGGQLDLWMPLDASATQLKREGLPARFLKIPGAKHGDYGPEAESTMLDALDWVTQQP